MEKGGRWVKYIQDEWSKTSLGFNVKYCISGLASGCMGTFVSFICETFVSFIAQKVWTLWFNLRPTSIPSVASTDKNCNQWKNVAADHSDKNVTTPQHHHNSKTTTIINIATGETSQAITPFHFFDNFNFHH